MERWLFRGSYIIEEKYLFFLVIVNYISIWEKGSL